MDSTQYFIEVYAKSTQGRLRRPQPGEQTKDRSDS